MSSPPVPSGTSATSHLPPSTQLIPVSRLALPPSSPLLTFHVRCQSTHSRRRAMQSSASASATSGSPHDAIVPDAIASGAQADKAFSCVHCARQFTRKENLNRHLKTRMCLCTLDQKPYVR